MKKKVKVKVKGKKKVEIKATKKFVVPVKAAVPKKKKAIEPTDPAKWVKVVMSNGNIYKVPVAVIGEIATRKGLVVPTLRMISRFITWEDVKASAENAKADVSDTVGWETGEMSYE